MGSVIVEQIQQVPLDKITVGDQVRKEFDQESLEGLASTLRSTGQLQPCRCRRVDDQLILVSGERRWRAAKLAGLKTIAVIIEAAGVTESDVLQKRLIENLQREELAPLEKAAGLAELMESTGWKVGEAASRLGMSSASVSRLLALLSLPQGIRDQVAAGVIPASAAYELSRVEDLGQQQELAKQIAAGRLTRDGLAGAIKGQSKASGNAPSAATGRATAQLGEGRAVTVVGQSLSLEGFIEILEELLAKARKVRPQGVELTTFIKMLKDQSRERSLA